MKYTILMSCGHEDTIELLGKGSDRDRKIAYLQKNGLCKKCYKKKMDDESVGSPFTLKIAVLPYINEKNGNILLNVWFDGDTKPHKEEIKSLGGYRWSERTSANDWFSTAKPPMCWNKVIEADEVNEEIEKAKAIGAECVDSDKGLFAMAHYQIALNKQKEWKEKHSKIAEIKEPIIPDILQNHKWNGKIYGKQGNYSVYLDNEKVAVTDGETEIIKEYLAKKEEYNRKVKEIKNA